MDPSFAAPQPEICRFDSPMLSGAFVPLFRRSADDGIAVLVMSMGDRDAVMPLHDVQRQYGIPYDSRDGLMLARIEEALDFVQEIRPGDVLPSEITSGDASWQPEAIHRHVAARMVRQQLLLWLDMLEADARGQGAPAGQPGTRRVPGDAPLDAVLHRLADRLHLSDPTVARQLLDALIKELAAIEALREWLLVSLRKTARKLDAIQQDRQGEGDNLDTVTQVRRLCRLALERIGSRFSDIDHGMEDLPGVLREWESRRVLLRSNRDWLYRSFRAFEPILREWDRAPMYVDDDFWNRLGRTYRFLAPRYMVVQEWRTPEQPTRRRRLTGPVMEW